MEIPRPELIPAEPTPDVIPFERTGSSIQARLQTLDIADSEQLHGEFRVVGSAIAAMTRDVTLTARQLPGEAERQSHELLTMFESGATPPWQPTHGVSLSVTKQDGPHLFDLLIQRPRA